MSELVTAAAFLLSLNDTPQLAVHFKIAPDWHIYWENPGDSGLATELEAPGLTEVRYMGPEKIIAAGNIVNYGYHQQTVMFAEVKKDFAADTPINLSWLVCKADQCIRQKTTVKAKKGDEKKNKQLQESFSQLPKPLPPQVSITQEKTNVWFTWPAKTTIELFPNADLEMQLTKANVVQEEQSTTLHLVLQQESTMAKGGLISVQTTQGTEYYLLSF